MELLLSDEQKLLQDSAVTLVERGAGPDRVRALREADGLDRALWNEIAEAGWFAILTPEEAGGFGLGMTELALVLEQAGRGLMTDPVGAGAVAARAIADGDSAELRENLLARITAGETIVTPAMAESAHAVDRAPETVAATDGDGYRLAGEKRFVASAAAADGFLVTALGRSGEIMCYVPADADGLTIETTATVDGDGFGALRMSGVAAPAGHVVAGTNRAPALAGETLDRMLLCLSAEMLGVMGQALDVAVEYLKVREQFDRPIGSFQALQHRAVNDYIEVETTRSLLFQAATAWDSGRGDAAMASAVKSKASAATLNVCKSAIQMHGAIGFTDEHDIGLYLKRAMALGAQYGNEAAHRARYARLTGIEPG